MLAATLLISSVFRLVLGIDTFNWRVFCCRIVMIPRIINLCVVSIPSMMSDAMPVLVPVRSPMPFIVRWCRALLGRVDGAATILPRVIQVLSSVC